MSQSPPSAAERPYEHRHHGVVRRDPFHWLRDRNDPAVIEYLRAENAYTEAQMAAAKPLEEELYKELIGRIEEDWESCPYRDGGYHYFSRISKGQNYHAYYRRKDSLGASEELYFDANEAAEGLDYFDLAYLEISPDGRWLAYAVDASGDEEYELKFRDLHTGVDLDTFIAPVSADGEWSGDGRFFYYTTENDTRRADKVLRHRFGTSPDKDEVVYEEPDAHFFVGIYGSQDRRFMFAYSISKETSEVHYLEEGTDPPGDFQCILPRKTGIRYFAEHREGNFLIRSNEGAVDFRLFSIPVDASRFDPARRVDASSAQGQGPATGAGRTRSEGEIEEILPGRDGVQLKEILNLKSHLVAFECVRGQDQIRVLNWADRSERVLEMPEPVYTLSDGNNAEYDAPTFQFGYASPIRPASTYEYDLNSGQIRCLKSSLVPSGHNPQDYLVERHHATAADGVEIPITIYYRRDRCKDGAGPALLYGYGAYGETVSPGFSRSHLSYLQRGFAVALAHVRGGGFLGEEWYQSGKLQKKQNTFEDFIRCAQYLIEEGVTSPENLVAEGGSAGGLLIGAVINHRPELFRAVLASVPFVDVVSTMLDESIPLTTFEYEEWGDPRNKSFFDYILSYSPYDNVKPQSYPAMLVTAGLNDSRVQYWEPAKWVAKLRKAHTGNSPILLKTNLDAGHGGASGRYEAYRETAFEQAFVLDQLGFSQ